MKVSKFISDFRQQVGDSTFDAPDDFLINGLNWALRDLPVNPRLAKLFTHHYTLNVDAEGHWRFDLTGDFFERVLDIEYLHFWTSTGGDPCPLKICGVSPAELYAGGLPQIMKKGKPCKYTLEREQDKLYLVLDRPSGVPIIIDYIAYGIPKEVKSLDDDVPITALCENALLELLRTIWYKEGDDFGFAGATFDYLDNKYIPQLVEEIHKRMSCEVPYIVGN